MEERLNQVREEMKVVERDLGTPYDKICYSGMQFLNIVHLDLDKYFDSFTELTPEIHLHLFTMYEAIKEQPYDFNDNYQRVKKAITFLFE